MYARDAFLVLAKAQALADMGQHASVVSLLEEQPESDLSRSPTLALLYGIALARLGRDAEGEEWVRTAWEQARTRGDRPGEARALNARGALALERGDIILATECFMSAVAEAKRVGDDATLGRCSNNLGIIANLRGDFGRAIGAYTRGLAAFERVRLHEGASQALHNLAITYRDQGSYAIALETADRAVTAAQMAGDLRLVSVTRAGRAEIRLRQGDAELARKESQHVVQVQDDIGNPVGRAEALRVWASAVGRLGHLGRAERALKEVIQQADDYHRPILGAEAARDLAELYAGAGNTSAARNTAEEARQRFAPLHAEWEIRRLDQLVEELEVTA
jgi:tetratricopeptide (TPR) repeat protein